VSIVASRIQTAALNKLNAAQKAFDAAVESEKKRPDRKLFAHTQIMEGLSP
jgi:hypothetical protein